MITAEIDKTAKDADIVIGDELTMSYIAASGKKYASIYNDDKAEFFYSFLYQLGQRKFRKRKSARTRLQLLQLEQP